jgi:hypothetical protein
MDIQDKKVLVLGGTGLIASYVTDGLIREGCGQITLFANKSKKEDGIIAAIKARYKGHPVESMQRNLMLDLYISKKKPDLRASFLLKLIKGERPDIIVDGKIPPMLRLLRRSSRLPPCFATASSTIKRRRWCLSMAVRAGLIPVRNFPSSPALDRWGSSPQRR